MSNPKEPILADDYPVYSDYFYIVSGEPVRSVITGRVRDLKRLLKVKEIRRCDMVGRGLAKEIKRS